MAAIAALFVFFVGRAGASAPPAQDPMGTVKHGVGQVLAIFGERDIPLKVRRDKLRSLTDQYFDFTDMARSALGYHWRNLTPTQRDKFVPLFAAFIQDAYLSKLQDYMVRKIQDEAKSAKIIFIRENFDGDDYAQVFSDIVLIEQKDPLHVNYLMHRRGGAWLIYDVTVEAISIIANYRNQFNRVINEDGFGQLVADLTAKQAQLEQLMNHPPSSEASAK